MTGTFSITHVITDNCGNTMTEVQTVNVSCLPAPDPDYIYEYASCSNTLHFTSPIPTGNHVWRLKQGNTVLATYNAISSLDISFPGTGTYEVTHSINGGQEAVKSFTFLGSNATSQTSASSLGINKFENQFVSIQGTFTNDLPNSAFSFINVDARMGPGASIVDDGNIRVTNSEFRACANMWKGFVINQGRQFSMSYSLVEDAQYGLDIASTSISTPQIPIATVSLANNEFNRNFIGVYIGRGASAKPQNVNISIYGNKFHSDGALSSNYQGQSSPQGIPSAGNAAYVGVWVADMAEITIGGSLAQNIFEKLGNGIYAERSRITVKNSSFHKMSPIQGYIGLTGCGIFVQGNAQGGAISLTQIGLGTQGPTTFGACKWGIYSVLQSVDIKDNNMQKVDVGIHVEKCKLGNINIFNNAIGAASAGIELLHNGNVSQSLSVKDCDIDIVPNALIPVAFGIRVEDDNLSYAGAEIHNNTVTALRDNSTGIFLRSTQAMSVRDNTIHLNEKGSLVGIAFQGGSRATLRDNTIIGSSNADASIGINVSNTPTIFYCCNTTTNTATGISITGMSESQNGFQANHLTGHSTGLLVSSGQTNTSVLGMQNHTGNRWHEDSQAMLIGALQLGLSNNNNNISNFRVDGGTLDFVPNEIFPPLGWFIIEGNPDPGCTPVCGACIVPSPVPNCFKDGDPGEFFKKLAQNAPEVQNYNAVVRWEGERQLFKNLLDDPSPMGQFAYMQTFFNQAANGVIGDFQDVEDGTKNIFHISPSTASQLNSINMDLVNYQNQVNAKRVALLTAPANQIGILEAEILVLLQQIGNVLDASNQLLLSVQSNAMATAATVATTNEAISTVVNFQANEKLVNKIYLSALANGNLELSTNAQQLLLPIANQCPYTGGTAVFKARSLMALIDPYLTYNDDQLCTPQFNSPSLPPTKSGEKALIGFYPNPANNWLTVSYELPEAQGLKLVIMDASGMELVRENLDSSAASKTIGISSLANGIYFCKIVDDEKIIAVEKLAILR